jgi:hypothetical protein
MVWLFWPLLLITVLIFGLITASIVLEVNSNSHLLRFRFGRIASIQMIWQDEMPAFLLKIFGVSKIVVLKNNSTRKVKTIVANKKTNRASKKISIKRLKKILNVLRSFKIKKLSINVDTGDASLNGILFPIMILLSSKYKRQLAINFNGEEEFILIIENSIGRMIRAYIK